MYFKQTDAMLFKYAFTLQSNYSNPVADTEKNVF